MKGTIPMNTFKKNGGFTLVELIIVIAILAILSAVAVAGYATYIKRANDSAVLSELTNISTSATLANAEAGGIASIQVKEENGKVKVVITADSTFASDFDTLFLGALTNSGLARVTVQGEAANTRTYEMTPSSAWNASDYSDDTINWNGSWPKAQ
jgi:prepilin-type N-terminal cleavage/methylation domain-containing protein